MKPANKTKQWKRIEYLYGLYRWWTNFKSTAQLLLKLYFYFICSCDVSKWIAFTLISYNFMNTSSIYSPTIPNADTSLLSPVLPILFPKPIMLRSWCISCLLYSNLSSTSISSRGSVLSILRTRNLVSVLFEPIK